MLERVLVLPRAVDRLSALLDSLARAAASVPRMERTVESGLVHVTGRVDQMLVLLTGAAEDLASLRRDTVEPQKQSVESIESTVERLDARIDRLQRSIDRLVVDVEDATELVRDGSKGPLAKVRDALSADEDPAAQS